ncbi:hypothetical protein CK203_052746 [Vitis vinifera]|uniref:Reverse transcriptase domain-containing protein n=1 Tax=Vitis vinifera TaxID=29760 RepID=A0A438FUT8_VITVI|nr:hypothetical protein CK203_052746 [Vitis vinifera]
MLHRGLGSRNKRRVVKDFLRSENPDVVMIQETKKVECDRRRNRKFIKILENESGLVLNNPKSITEEILLYFEKLYTSPTGESWSVEGLNWSPISEESASRLDSPFIEEEISKAIFQLDRDKAPGPDGFTIAIFQDCWDVIKEDLVRVFAEFHRILVNGNAKGWVKASRGLRQSEPLSPFLFTLVADVLSRMLLRAEERNSLEGFRGWEGKRDHLVSWDVVCNPKAKGGLGFGKISLRNLTLLGKWLWRYPRDGSALWYQVILSIYGSHSNGWDANTIVRWRWEKNLVLGRFVMGDQPLGSQYPRLFRAVSDKNIPISSILDFTRPFSGTLISVRKTLKVLVERKTFLIRLEGEQGGEWCSMTEISRGSVFALGFEKEAVGWGKCRVHLMEVGFNNHGRFIRISELATNKKPSVLIIPEGDKGRGWENIKKMLSSMLVVPYPIAVEKGRNIRGESWPHNNVGLDAQILCEGSQ